jgi:hypothetical protein
MPKTWAMIVLMRLDFLSVSVITGISMDGALKPIVV